MKSDRLLELKEINARLGLVLENTPIAIWDWNLEADTWMATSKYYTMLGYEAEMGFSDREIWIKRVHPDERELVLSKIEKILQHDDDDYSYDARMLHANGSYRWQTVIGHVVSRDEEGKATRILGVRVDIDERKQAELALKESSELNTLLLQTIPFAIDIVDEQGTVLFQNEMLKTLFERDAIGQKCWELYRDDKCQCSDCPLLKGLKIGETEIYETGGVLGGRTFQISHTGMLFDGKNALLEIFQDITERKQTELDLIAAKEKAEESDRLKSAFLANMSHEIRTPLNSIIGFSELLTDPDFDTDQRSNFAQLINENGNSLLSILSDIMDLSKIEAGQIQVKKSQFIANRLATDIKNEFLFKAKSKGNEIRLNLPDYDVLVCSDQPKIRQILVNLVSNALKFTEQGYVEIGLSILDNQVRFHVKDSGIGIHPEFHRQIFERFRQVDSSYTRRFGGNGLGLAISKSLIEKMDGSIWVESEVGKGTTFFFILPVE